MTSQALTFRALGTFAALGCLLLASSAAASDDAAQLEPVLPDAPHTFLVSSADLGATTLDWYTRTVEAQPVPPGMLSLSKAKQLFLQLAGGTLTGPLSFGSGVTQPSIRMLYDQTLAWCSAANCATYAYWSFVSGTATLQAQQSSGVPPPVGAASFVASNGGFIARNGAAAIHLGSAGTERMTWTDGANFTMSFMTLEMLTSATLQIDTSSTLLAKAGSVVRFESTAAGGLPTCDASHLNAIYFPLGTIVTDAVFCNGAYWESFGALTVSGYYDGNTTAANTPITGFSSFYGSDTGASFGKLDVTITKAGTDGAHSATWRIQNTSTATTVCTSTFLCNHAVGRIEVACTAGSTIQVANNLELQVDESACVAPVPLGNGIWQAR